jgi:protein-disulfide isomerase
MTEDAQRKRRLFIFGGLLAAAIAAVAIAIAAGSGGGSNAGGTSSASGGPALKGVAAVRSEFAGIPQKGNVLGTPSAPATMVVFADLQCPFCAEFENSALPSIVSRYVKPGKLKVVFQPIVILGNDSVLGARAAAAAAQQGKMFDFNAVLYRNQGQENTGYLNTAYVKRIASAVPGVNVGKLVAELKSHPVNSLLTQAQNLATSGHVSSTPTFFVARKGATLQPLQVTALNASAFYATLDKLTR